MHLLLNYFLEEEPFPEVEFQVNKIVYFDTFGLLCLFQKWII